MAMRAILSVAALTAAAAACILDAPDPAGTTESAASSIVSCTAGARPSTGLALQPALGNRRFAEPVGMVASPADPSVFYVVEREGAVKRVTASGAASTFLALGSKVEASAGEGG